MSFQFSFHFEQTPENDRTTIDVAGEGYLVVHQTCQETGLEHSVVLAPQMKDAFLQAWGLL